MYTLKEWYWLIRNLAGRGWVVIKGRSRILFRGVKTDCGVVRKHWQHSKVWKASMHPIVAPTGTSSKTAESPTFTAEIELEPHACTSL